jgi:hypothetical protein
MTIETSLLELVRELWSRLDAEGRHALASWVQSRCLTCGRKGEWGGVPPVIDNTWCDKCCEQEIAALNAERGEATP